MIKEWVVGVTPELKEALIKNLNEAKTLENGKQFLVEHYVGTFIGLKVEIFSDEHPPPHFRVKNGSKSANYSIKDCEKINGNMTGMDKSIKKWHSENKEKLIEIWNNSRPSDCPVGVYRE